MVETRRGRDWEAIYRIVREQPGIYKRNLAELIGAGAREMDGKMCGMDHAGYLLAEDELGRLWVMEGDEW